MKENFKIYASVFSFDNRFDFQAGSISCDIDYAEDTRVLEFLGKIPKHSFSCKEFAYDSEFVAIRINGIAVVENVLIIDLVKRFGQIWQIEPLSIKYCKKDLLLDYDYMFNYYSSFFKSAPFIGPKEQEELKKYLIINCIASRDEEYFGDGFLLYIKWLIPRHPTQRRHLLKTISSKRGGIMSYSSTACLMYPPNNAIDSEIEYLQSVLVSASRCPISKGEWISLGHKINDRYDNFKALNALPKAEAKSKCPIMKGSMD